MKQHQGYQNVDEYFNQRNYGTRITSVQELLEFARKEISNLKTSKPNEVTGLRLSQELWKQCMLEEDIKRINRRNNPSVQNGVNKSSSANINQSQQNAMTQNQSQSSQQNQPTGPKENCEALFTAERRQRLSGPQYAQEHIDCLGRIVARSKAQTAAPVVAPTSQDAQQQAQQSQQLAAQNQTRADQARQGQRKTHDPAAEAHDCIAIDNAGSGNFGAFKNMCGYKVNFLTCNYKPRVIQGGFNWSADFDCEQQKLGLHTPDGGRAVAAHNRNTELVYWFACKAPASPVDLTFVSGEGIKGRCHTVGGK